MAKTEPKNKNTKKSQGDYTLVIVESPAKEKTVKKYLGPGYKVKASVGHIRDLPKSNKDAVDIENGYKPNYQIVPAKAKVAKEIQLLANRAHKVLLATDPDREGEAIAWHVAEAAGIKNPKRIVFHEITQGAVSEAVLHPRAIDMNLKEAQEARRVLDRLIGYDLSGLIWKKLRYGLSAGRVQSPALRILAEREREIKAFIPTTYWVLSAEVKPKSGHSFLVTASEEPTDRTRVDEILHTGKNAKWHIEDVKETEQRRSPRPPFITSTLQQTASSRLGFSPSRTMSSAQKLYEAGHITYMRTDSTNLAQVALADIEKVVKSEYGREFYQPHTYSKKSKSAQEAHEAIRPTDMSQLKAGTTEDQKKIYSLIRSRTLASQMQDAKVLRTKVTTGTNDSKVPTFSVSGQRVIFEGWLKADPMARGEDVEVPKVDKGMSLDLVTINDEEKETQPAKRYTEAGLVKELEKRGIGRPSTYASIIRTIQERGYVEKEGRSLMVTDTGDVVSQFLEDHFGEYISDDFTAEMEQELDDIAEGKREYVATLDKVYKPFSKVVESKQNIEKITNLGKADAKYKCPKCKSNMIIKLSKSGKFLSCEKFPDCDGARTIEGEELEGDKPTGEKCPQCEKGDLMEKDGRFGRFIACSNYPKCKFIKEDPNEVKKRSTGVACTSCKDGELVEKRGRFGIFYACSNYPDCKFAINAKPTGEKCDMCGALMMQGTKTIPDRCSDKTCPNHRPDKLGK